MADDTQPTNFFSPGFDVSTLRKLDGPPPRPRKAPDQQLQQRQATGLLSTRLARWPHDHPRLGAASAVRDLRPMRRMHDPKDSLSWPLTPAETST